MPTTGRSGARLRWAVVGAGTAGRARAQAIVADPRSALVAVWRGRFAADLGAPIADSLEAAIDRADVVAIASPSEVHAAQVEAVLDRQRHVLVEYPLAPTRAEAAALFGRARAAGKILHEEHIELLDAATVTLAAHIRPEVVEGIEIRHEARGEVAATPHSLAIANVARLHRAIAIGGPVAAIAEVGFAPGEIAATLTFTTGATLHARFGVGPEFQRRTTLTIRTVAGTWEQRDGQVYRDGTPITLVGLGGLFARDHRAAVARILDGAPPYVDEARILHVLDIVDALSALRRGPLVHQSDAATLPQ